MLTYLLDVGDLADARFVVSPLNETVLSLFHLNHVHASAPHLAGWRREADTRRDRYDRGLIDALVSRSGHQIPDFLTPAMTARTRPSFDAHLELVAATGADVARAELLELAEGEAPSAQLHTLIEHADPVGTVVEALDGYHRSAIAPLWPVIERILESDVTFRGRELANGGPGRRRRAAQTHRCRQGRPAGGPHRTCRGRGPRCGAGCLTFRRIAEPEGTGRERHRGELALRPPSPVPPHRARRSSHAG